MFICLYLFHLNLGLNIHCLYLLFYSLLFILLTFGKPHLHGFVIITMLMSYSTHPLSTVRIILLLPMLTSRILTISLLSLVCFLLTPARISRMIPYHSYSSRNSQKSTLRVMQ